MSDIDRLREIIEIQDKMIKDLTDVVRMQMNTLTLYDMRLNIIEQKQNHIHTHWWL